MRLSVKVSACGWSEVLAHACRRPRRCDQRQGSIPLAQERCAELERRAAAIDREIVRLERDPAAVERDGLKIHFRTV
jgi:hypothetical protein